eukprot:1397194-Rhodomonas_salina.1
MKSSLEIESWRTARCQHSAPRDAHVSSLCECVGVCVVCVCVCRVCLCVSVCVALRVSLAPSVSVSVLHLVEHGDGERGRVAHDRQLEVRVPHLLPPSSASVLSKASVMMTYSATVTQQPSATVSNR